MHGVLEGIPPRGLTPMETESVATVLGVGNHTDLCAKYSMGSDETFPNVWPDDNFKDVWMAYHNETRKVSESVSN